MKKITTTLVLASFLALFLIISVSAVSDTIHVSGDVYNTSVSNVLGNANVTVTCNGTSVNTYTYVNGSYDADFFSGCASNSTINVNASKPGFTNASTTAILATPSCPGGECYFLANIVLHPASTPAPVLPNVTVKINSPLSKTYTTHSIGINISYNSTPNSLDYCSYNITDSTGKTIVNDTNMSCSTDSTSSQTLPNGKYILYAFANDTSGNLNTSMVSFIVSVSSPSPSPPSGGGGGNAVYPGTCITQWNCTAWSACLGGTETRTCTYPTGYCTPTTAEPATSQTCTAPAESQANTTAGTTSGSGAPITGGVIGALGGTQGILAIILLIAVIALALFFSSRKKKENLEVEAGK